MEENEFEWADDLPDRANKTTDKAESVNMDDIPPLVCLGDYLGNMPAPPPEMIEGILRKGHKLLLSGPSKAGKSVLLMELAIAFACGSEWLGFPCRKSRVLYLNFEIEPASFLRRFQDICDVLDTTQEDAENIVIWNLRGSAKPIDTLVPGLNKVIIREKIDAVIIDPIYKIISGDENSASDMANICNQFDRIASECGCSVIYCHHHAKGANSTNRTGNRLSGSGVFTRDVDALLDIIQLKYDSDSDKTAWHMESVLREFPNIRPINMFFCFPQHIVDETGELDNAPFMDGGSKKAQQSRDLKKKRLDDAYNACEDKGVIRLSDLAEKMCCSDKTVRTYIYEIGEPYFCDKGVVIRKGD